MFDGSARRGLDAVSSADQEAVARAWVECAGLGGLAIAVHPRDEMQAFLAAASPRTDAHRFEPELVFDLAQQAGLAVVGWVERELWDLQDVFVARRAPASAPSRIASAPLLYCQMSLGIPP